MLYDRTSVDVSMLTSTVTLLGVTAAAECCWPRGVFALERGIKRREDLPTRLVE